MNQKERGSGNKRVWIIVYGTDNVQLLKSFFHIGGTAMKGLSASLLLAAVLLAPCVAGADELVLKSGDKLMGKVVGLAGGKLSFETPYAGVLKVDWAQVASLKTDGKVSVKLKTKEILEGKLSAGGEGRLKVETEGAAQPVEVDMAGITHFNEPPTMWHGNLTISAKTTDGNTHTASGLIVGEGSRVTEEDLLLVRFIFRYGERNGDIQERNGYGLAKYQKNLYEGLYGYASVELASDKFRDLDLGTVVSAGFGYELVKKAKMDLTVEAGIAYFDNNFHELQKDESHVGARASLRLRVALPLGFEGKDIFTIYPNFEETQDWQIRNEATLGTSLGGGWSLLAGVITEYDHRPSATLERYDDTYFVGLGFVF
jgi:hypothetical protein